SIHQNFSSSARNRSKAGVLELLNYLTHRHSKDLRKVVKLRRAERVNVDLWIFLPDVMQQVQVVVYSQLGVMTALHQNLNPAYPNEFVNFLVNLFVTQDIVVRIPLSPVKRAKFTINITDVRVVDVAINYIGNDFASPAIKSMLLRHLTP